MDPCRKLTQAQRACASDRSPRERTGARPSAGGEERSSAARRASAAAASAAAPLPAASTPSRSATARSRADACEAAPCKHRNDKLRLPTLTLLPCIYVGACGQPLTSSHRFGLRRGLSGAQEAAGLQVRHQALQQQQALRHAARRRRSGAAGVQRRIHGRQRSIEVLWRGLRRSRCPDTACRGLQSDARLSVALLDNANC